MRTSLKHKYIALLTVIALLVSIITVFTVSAETIISQTIPSEKSFSFDDGTVAYRITNNSCFETPNKHLYIVKSDSYDKYPNVSLTLNHSNGISTSSTGLETCLELYSDYSLDQTSLLHQFQPAMHLKADESTIDITESSFKYFDGELVSGQPYYLVFYPNFDKEHSSSSDRIVFEFIYHNSNDHHPADEQVIELKMNESTEKSLITAHEGNVYSADDINDFEVNSCNSNVVNAWVSHTLVKNDQIDRSIRMEGYLPGKSEIVISKPSSGEILAIYYVFVSNTIELSTCVNNEFSFRFFETTDDWKAFWSNDIDLKVTNYQRPTYPSYGDVYEHNITMVCGTLGKHRLYFEDQSGNLLAEIYVDVKDHEWESDYQIDKQADHFTPGSKSIHCKLCGTIKEGSEEVIPAEGHSGVLIKGHAATCTEDGLTDGEKCSVCNEWLTKQEVIPAKGHQKEVVKGYAATCTKEGLTDGEKCSVCGEWITKQEVIKAKGHTFEKGVCTVCGEKDPNFKPEPTPAPVSKQNGLADSADSNGDWWFYKDGKIDKTHNGVDQNKYGWWRVENGKVNFNAQGIYQNRMGWWKTTNGKVTFKETGVFQNNLGWWRVKDSKVDFNAQSIYQNQFGWWKTTNGKVTFKENGLFKNQYGTWKVENSKVNFNFNGSYQGKTIKNGKVV